MFNETMNGVMHAGYMNDGVHQNWGYMHGPFSILLVIGFVFLVIWLFRRGGHSNGVCGHGSSGSALTTLSERFAKGEIEEEEFRAKRGVLKSKK
ncbi:MAG: SHOCT domain-containing protein [Rhodospirillales bacterium]|nr:SHOCT domain-containing protein [Rhodospirillales bacterium]